MLCTCPACGFHAPLFSFTAEQEAHEYADLMARVPPPLAHLVKQYVQMFAPAKHKMTFGKGCRVLEPLVLVIEAGAVRYAKRDWPVTLPQISETLAYMVGKRAELTLPLKNHGYLFKVLAAASGHVEAQAEKAVEQSRQAGKPQAAPAAERDEQGTNRVRAIQELTQQIAACRRLQTTATPESMRRELAKLGFAASDIDFALSKVPLSQE